jgi:hypothetical protein
VFDQLAIESPKRLRHLQQGQRLHPTASGDPPRCRPAHLEQLRCQAGRIIRRDVTTIQPLKLLPHISDLDRHDRHIAAQRLFDDVG